METFKDKRTQVRIAMISNFICAFLMVVDALIRCFEFPTKTDPFFYVLTFYLLGFAALLVISELKVKKIMDYIQFLKTRIGKGIYLIFIGLLVMDPSRIYEIVISMIFFFIGSFNIVVSATKCERKDGPKPWDHLTPEQ